MLHTRAQLQFNIMVTHAVKKEPNAPDTDCYLRIERTDRQRAGEEALLRLPLLTAEGAASHVDAQKCKRRHTKQLLG